ncbi:MAG: carboxymuconolactone decarboxylase family protein [Candidatus Thorarchaeota archaeon]
MTIGEGDFNFLKFNWRIIVAWNQADSFIISPITGFGRVFLKCPIGLDKKRIIIVGSGGYMSKIDAFNRYRDKMNEIILEKSNLEIKRFFNLDTRTYYDGALSAKTKELLGLVASMVLRCNDCITYHILQCRQLGTTEAEFYEAFTVALVVGGSIVIPHLRKAVEMLEEALETS